MKKVKTIKIDENIWKEFKLFCVKYDLKIGDVIADLINEHIQKQKEVQNNETIQQR